MQKLYYPFFIFVLMLISLQVYTQAGTWTWINGDTTGNPTGNFGNKGVPDSANTPPGLGSPASWTDLQGNFWLFGGENEFGDFYDDLWKYDPLTNYWTWISGSGTTNDENTGVYGTRGVPSTNNHPGGRFEPASWTDNNGDLWLYGCFGLGYSGIFNRLNDLWKYNIASGEWTWEHGSDTTYAPPVWGTQGVPDSLNTPGARDNTTATWVDSANNLWLFGGIREQGAPTGAYNDLWKFDTHINQWTWMKGADSANSYANYGTLKVAANTNCPGPRGAYCSWKDAHGNFWLFGGQLYDNFSSDFDVDYNDLWKYEPASNNWIWMDGTRVTEDTGVYGPLCQDSNGYLPSARDGNNIRWTDDYGNFWMYGGNSTAVYVSPGYPDDMWYLYPDSLKWTLVYGQVDTVIKYPAYGIKGVPDTSNDPGWRGGGPSWRDKNGNLYLFGGAANATLANTNDLWKYVPDTTCIHAPTVNTSVVTAITALREQQINIFPNPTATGDFHLSISADLIGGEVDIFNMNGEVVYRSVVHSPGSEISLNVAAGVYTVRVVSANTSITKKLIRL